MENFKYRSENIDQLITALSKAQGAYKDIIPDEDAPGGKFASARAIIKATREALSINAISFFQQWELLDEGSGASLLKSILAHGSGQYISSFSRVVMGKTERATGSILEIHKRRHMHMLLGTAPTKYDPAAFDDDGQELSEQFVVDQLKKPKEKREIDSASVISKHQYEDLMIELDGYPTIVKQIQETYNIETLADLPKTEYHPSLNQIRRIKKNLETYGGSK